VTALVFDVGVYLVVVGLVLDVLRSLGARVDVELGQQQAKVATP
jgi:multicomponent Na+:H+ antiporter subunit A